MKLRELLRGRRDWADEDTIYVIEPWGGDADALLSNAAPDTTGPTMQGGQSYAYFLKSFIASDLLDDLDAPDDVDEATCERLIQYATDDACKPGGVPRVDDRRVLNSIFWVLRSGGLWRDWRERYGPRTNCYYP